VAWILPPQARNAPIVESNMEKPGAGRPVWKARSMHPFAGAVLFLDLPENIFSLTSALRRFKVRPYDPRTKKYFFECTEKLVVAQP
jgi:hypothetical protein